MTDEARRVAMGQTYAVDDRGLFCQHCGRTTLMHYPRNGKYHCRTILQETDNANSV